jgi:hypothetical protein
MYSCETRMWKTMMMVLNSISQSPSVFSNGLNSIKWLSQSGMVLLTHTITAQLKY